MISGMTDNETPGVDDTATPPLQDPPPPPQSGSQRSGWSPPPLRSLTRRSHDRVVGGVAGGLGDYFNVDPAIFRLVFVGLSFAGGPWNNYVTHSIAAMVERLRDDARVDMAITRMLDGEVATAAPATDDEVKEFYDKNPEKFKQGEAVRASHILVAVPQGADGITKDKAREKADHREIEQRRVACEEVTVEKA